MSTTTSAARRVRVAAAAALALGSLLVAAAPAQAVSTDRWWGADRHATAASVSAGAFAGGASAVVVVNGGSFADALAAAPLAASLQAPLLTTTAAALPAATRAEVARLRPQTVWVVGGGAAVSDPVATELGALAGGDVRRLAGLTRYDTAARIAQAGASASSSAEAPGEVYLSSGEGFADALSAGAAGAAKGAPLLLTTRDALPAETLAALRALAPTRITVVGGTSVVSPAVQGQLEAQWPGKVRRISGDDRYDTAARVAKDLTTDAPQVLLASGANFPDALAGAALGRPLLLSRPDCLPQVTADAYTSLGTTSVTGLGGTGVLSDAALAGTVCASAPAPSPSGSPSSTPSPSSSPSSTPGLTGSTGGDVFYGSCADVRAAGKAPLRRGQPGYTTRLDRDGDGIACE